MVSALAGASIAAAIVVAALACGSAAGVGGPGETVHRLEATPSTVHVGCSDRWTLVPANCEESRRRLIRLDRDRRVAALGAARGSKDAFMARVRQAAAGLRADGFLLERDVHRVEERASAHWDWVQARPTSTVPSQPRR